VNASGFWATETETAPRFLSSILAGFPNDEYDASDPEDSPFLLEFDSPALSLESLTVTNVTAGEFVTIDGTDYYGKGYVAHGPAVFSDVFDITRPLSLTLDWRATDQVDYYSVLGYVVITATCEQIEVISETGGDSGDWRTVTVAIPEAASYRFLFVSGTYEYYWGGDAGANYSIDNVQIPIEETMVEPDQLAATGTGLDLPVGVMAAALLMGAGLPTRLIWPISARRRSMA
jgi:hypothetical protein